MARKYRQKKRAEHQEETRHRIITAAVELIELVGPARITISAIAERAGVERPTVYRHFPDERALFVSCLSYYATTHPVPDPTRWQQIAEPETRLRIGLTEIYTYHRQTEQMAKQVTVDVPDLPIFQDVLQPYSQPWTGVREILTAAWDTMEEQRVLVTAIIGHAMAFQTWHSLVREQGLGDAQAIELMVALVKQILPLLLH